MNNDSIPWKLLNLYFRDNPSFLVTHHIESYNEFFEIGLPRLLKEKNPIHFFKEQQKVTIDKETKFVGYTPPSGIEQPITFEEMDDFFSDESTDEKKMRWDKARKSGPLKTLQSEEYRYQAELYIGGIDGSKIYYGKPIIYNKDSKDKFMYPNEARLKNFTYSFTIHYDIDINFILYLPLNDGSDKHVIQHHSITLEKIYMGKFPIMLRSNLCILNGLSPQVRHNMGEDSSDVGGYFIIDGKEKVIVSQEKFADNMLYIQKDPNDIESYSAKIRSVSEDASKPVRTLSVKIIKETASLSNGQIVVSIPNVRKPVPLFILMRALGIISDKEIIKHCILDLDNYSHYLPSLRASIHDAGPIFTQQAALKYIVTLTKGKTESHAIQILMVYFLPHMGELNFKQKALYLGYVVKRLLKVVHNEEKPTNRDSYKYKRLEITGTLIYDLFREYYTKQQKNIFLQMDSEYFYTVKKNVSSYQNKEFINLINDNQTKIFSNRIVEDGFRRAFKGDWGSEAHTKKPGALQDLSRLSYFSTLAQMRKTNTPIGSDGAKVTAPRFIDSTQWGIICPIHSPDGGNTGLHNHLTIMAYVTKRLSGYPFIEYLKQTGFNMQLLEECSIDYIANITKIFVNGAWIGVTPTPENMREQLILHRRNGLFSVFISITWDIDKNEIHILTDAGRPCHPLFHINGNSYSFEKDKILDMIENKTLRWNDCLMGTAKKSIQIDITNDNIYPVSICNKGQDLRETGAIIEYLDTHEMESAMLAKSTDNKDTFILKKITHTEIDSSVILSMMANQIILPSTNPYPRNAFSCGQSKQAVSMFHTNFQNRMDKTSILLNCGQNPLVRSRYFEPITQNQHPYGVNAIVAIACYSGYNVEDSIIINKSALDRGIFRTTYFNVYEATEETTKVGNMEIRSNFMDINNNDVIGLKPGYDYSHLDTDSGLIGENILIDEKTIIIGKAVNSFTSSDSYVDESIGTKKGQAGYVDKSFMTEGENGKRLAKVRIRHDRIPAIGDKFCSRAGQKGTIGIILNEEDMPYTEDGIRPDIIVNPHALPSRMTVGHLVEVLIGKVAAINGGLGDCTAFANKGPKEQRFGEILTANNYNSTGNEILYNGMTGEQMETEIYIGPTYYLRLKHMVKDKINFRARGPRTALTRQTVQGRSNDGGLRIGEMDRDAIICHGMSHFMYESMMERGDKYYMAICNNTGTIAVYNEDKDIFLSPMSDGPLQFSEALDGTLNIVPISKYGKTFSIVKVPYAFKLLYQELQAMNVQMRIITADNVEQLTNTGHSDNLFKLTGLNSFIEQIDANTEKITGIKKIVLPNMSPLSPGIDPFNFNDTAPQIDPTDPGTTGFAPVFAPEFTPMTSEFTPMTSEFTPMTPEVVPMTPDVAPMTPDVAPMTPDVAPMTPDVAPMTPDVAPMTPEVGPPIPGVEITPSSLELPPLLVPLDELKPGDINRKIIEPMFDKDLELLKTKPEDEKQEDDNGDDIKKIE